MRFDDDKIPVPQRFLPAWLQRVLRDLAWAINFLDDRNFPQPLTGDTLIKGGSLSGSALKPHSVTMSSLDQLQWFVPLLLVEPAAQSTQTAATGIGPYLHWDPTQWPATATWTLEATLYTAGATAYVDLYDSVAAVSVASSQLSTGQTSTTRLLSPTLTMPGHAVDLYLRLWTSNAAQAAYLKGARLIMTP